MADDWDDWTLEPKKAEPKPEPGSSNTLTAEEWSAMGSLWNAPNTSNGNGAAGKGIAEAITRSGNSFHRAARGRGFQSRPAYVERIAPQPETKPSWNKSATAAIRIPSSNTGMLIGRGGETIKRLQFESGAKINVDRDNYGDETEVYLVGEEDQIAKARQLILKITSYADDDGKVHTEYTEQPAQDEGPTDWEAAIRESEASIQAKWDALPPIRKNFYFENPEIAALPSIEVASIRLESNNVMVSHFDEKDRRVIPNPIQTFEQAFEHFPDVLAEITKNNFVKPTPIQSQTWPILLQGFDLIGIAQTGTGKTLAYLLPAMIHIDNQLTPRNKRKGPTALILAPVRELAQQIEKECRKYSYHDIRSICVYGGADKRSQADAIRQGVEIVIATPGRLDDLSMSGMIDLSSVSYLVLDEADRMLDMGFEPQIKKILIDIRPDRQTVLTSATWPENVRRMATKYMCEPLQVFVGTLDLSATHSVTQQIIFLERPTEKEEYLDKFLSVLDESAKAIVFVGRKFYADELSSNLAIKGVKCQSIHGDRVQFEREEALLDFKKGVVRVLVATDVASRGLDIDDITHILNFDFPRNIEEYVHRIGRTGRAGRQGVSITFMTSEDWRHAPDLIKILAEADQEVPQELLDLAENYPELKAKKDAADLARRSRRYDDYDDDDDFYM